MSTVDDIVAMQSQGASEEQIIQTLRSRNISYKEIVDALAQSKIKTAVQQPEPEPPLPYNNPPVPSQAPGMERSMMSVPVEQAPVYSDQNQYYPQQQYEYPPQTSQGVSSDLITEISEQVVAEKLSDLRKHLEKIADMKSTIESRIEYLDERLKRMERIIDTLQSSVLRKVGDYVTNIQDIKNELIETQKTFSKIIDVKKQIPQKETKKDKL